MDQISKRRNTRLKEVRYYPLFLDLKDRLCIVIGGGVVAERKVLSLLQAGASVRVISPDLTPLLADLKKEGRIQHTDRHYQNGDLMGAFLVIAATSDMEVNRAVYAEAIDRPVNVVDVPELCSFIVPSVVSRGHLTIAISTSGVSPALAKSIREELQELFSEDMVEFLQFLEVARKKIKEQEISPDERQEILKELGSRRVLKMLLREGARKVIEELKSFLIRKGIQCD